ncbi:hypothetical protein ABZ671_18995 [Micromonospora sp. NPDC006766]|uniref:hypothetical protein n=1 Tax=Micromonospora sp. NPDC006766 TaxID=3154778 RepID=UPI0033CCE055
MPFGITHTRRINFHLGGDVTAPFIHPASDDEILQVRHRLADPNGVIEMEDGDNISMLPVRSIIYVEVERRANTSSASVELYQDADGGLYLRDPDEDLAYGFVDTPAACEFRGDAEALITGDWDLTDTMDQPRPIDGLTLIATYKHSIRAVMPVWRSNDGPDAPREPIAGAEGQRYIGKQALAAFDRLA